MKLGNMSSVVLYSSLWRSVKRSYAEHVEFVFSSITPRMNEAVKTMLCPKRFLQVRTKPPDLVDVNPVSALLGRLIV